MSTVFVIRAVAGYGLASVVLMRYTVPKLTCELTTDELLVLWLVGPLMVVYFCLESVVKLLFWLMAWLVRRS